MSSSHYHFSGQVPFTVSLSNDKRKLRSKIIISVQEYLLFTSIHAKFETTIQVKVQFIEDLSASKEKLKGIKK